MCVGLFSITAHAEESIQDNYTIMQEGSFSYNYGQTQYGLDWLEFDLNNKLSRETLTNSQSWLTNNSLYYGGEYWQDYKIYNTDKSYIMQKGETYKVKLNQFYFSAYVQANTSYYVRNPSAVVGWVTYNDNSTESIEVQYTHVTGSPLIDFNFSFTPAKDVQSFVIRVKASTRNTSPSANAYAGITSYYGFHGDSTYQYIVDIQSEEAGLLQGVINKLTSGFSALGDKLSSVVNGILELPQKLWNLISDGLKSLFVPSEESMTDYKNKWDTLLSERLGAVYQVVNITLESWDGIMQADETDTIEFPQATVNFSGTPFTFGGYSVKIVPDGFDLLVTAIKSIVGIVCTVMLVNGLRKRYDEVMGVEQ